MAWVATYGVDEIDREDVRAFRHEGVDYAVYRSPDDGYYATAGRCTHARERLCDGLVLGGIVECPGHNGRFDYTTGQAMGPPVLVDLATYPVRVENGTIYLELTSEDP